MMERINQDISTDILEAARLLQSLIDSAVKRAQAEQPAPSPPVSPAFVTTEEAARALNVKPRTIYAYVEQGKLAPHRTGPRGGKLMFAREEIERARSA